MIFAAGLGTRLRPLTDDRPKALVELEGKPLLEHVLLKMQQAGIRKIIVNVHHYADLIEQFLRLHPHPGLEILVSDERDCLLDTGGGLLKARSLFDPGESVLIHNVDIFSDLDLKQLIAAHENNRNYATLVVREAGKGRVLRFNAAGYLKGWENQQTGEQKIVDDDFYTARKYSFCGIHMVSPEFLQQIGHQGVFSIIDEYLFQAKKQALQMYFYPGRFMDLGTPQAIETARQWIKNTIA